jgi:hypothetical protein
MVERLPIEKKTFDSTVRKYTRESSFPGGFCTGITGLFKKIVGPNTR